MSLHGEIWRSFVVVCQLVKQWRCVSPPPKTNGIPCSVLVTFFLLPVKALSLICFQPKIHFAAEAFLKRLQLKTTDYCFVLFIFFRCWVARSWYFYCGMGGGRKQMCCFLFFLFFFPILFPSCCLPTPTILHPDNSLVNNKEKGPCTVCVLLSFIQATQPCCCWHTVWSNLVQVRNSISASQHPWGHILSFLSNAHILFPLE